MLTKDGRDTPIHELTADNYIVPKGEEKDYHVVLELRRFSQTDGKRISKARIQKVGKKMFETVCFPNWKKQGYAITILHDPNEWLKAQKAKALEQAKSKAEAEKARFDAAVAAAVAKALAERESNAEATPKKGGRAKKEQ